MICCQWQQVAVFLGYDIRAVSFEVYYASLSLPQQYGSSSVVYAIT